MKQEKVGNKKKFKGFDMWGISDSDFWWAVFWFAVICGLAGWGLSELIGWIVTHVRVFIV